MTTELKRNTVLPKLRPLAHYKWQLEQSTTTFSGGYMQAKLHFLGDSWDEIRGIPGDSGGFRGIPRQQCVQCPAKNVIKIGTTGNCGKGFLRLSCTPL